MPHSFYNFSRSGIITFNRFSTVFENVSNTCPSSYCPFVSPSQAALFLESRWQMRSCSSAGLRLWPSSPWSASTRRPGSAERTGYAALILLTAWLGERRRGGSVCWPWEGSHRSMCAAPRWSSLRRRWVPPPESEVRQTGQEKQSLRSQGLSNRYRYSWQRGRETIGRPSPVGWLLPRITCG